MSKEMKKLANTNLVSSIVTIRGLKVILDADLAKIYGVTTKRLNEQTKRNSARFQKKGTDLFLPRDGYFPSFFAIATCNFSCR